MGQEATLILLALLCLGCVHSYPSDGFLDLQLQTFRQAETVQFCGDHLTQLMALVCKGNYNSLMQQKRNGDFNGQLQYPFKRREESNTFRFKRRRRRRGLSDECCKKPCTREELNTFCGPNSPFQ